MHYLRAFLLATTFVTAVVASPIRRDQLGDLTNSTNKAISSLQTLNPAIEGLATLPLGGHGGVQSQAVSNQFQAVTLAYTVATVNVNATANLVRAAGSLPSDVSQTFISQDMLQLFTLLNGTATATNGQLPGLGNKIGNSAVLQMQDFLITLSSVKDNLEDAIVSVSDSDSVQLLKSFTSFVDINFNTVALTINGLVPASIITGSGTCIVDCDTESI